jgi:hypothetical protein
MIENNLQRGVNSDHWRRQGFPSLAGHAFGCGVQFDVVNDVHNLIAGEVVIKLRAHRQEGQNRVRCAVVNGLDSHVRHDSGPDIFIVHLINSWHTFVGVLSVLLAHIEETTHRVCYLMHQGALDVSRRQKYCQVFVSATV